VLRVSELHVWGLGGRRVALTAHLQVQSEPSVDLLRLGEERLRQLGIDHSTLQIEPQS
jgi:Co/Zn/Cd efflux system component